MSFVDSIKHAAATVGDKLFHTTHLKGEVDAFLAVSQAATALLEAIEKALPGDGDAETAIRAEAKSLTERAITQVHGGLLAKASAATPSDPED